MAEYLESLASETRLEAFLMDLAFCPDERSGGVVVVGDERFDMGDEFGDALKRGAVEGFSREDREPDFDLIEPGGVRGA